MNSTLTAMLSVSTASVSHLTVPRVVSSNTRETGRRERGTAAHTRLACVAPLQVDQSAETQAQVAPTPPTLESFAPGSAPARAPASNVLLQALQALCPELVGALPPRAARLPASDRTGASHARPRGWRRFPRRCCDRFGEVLVLVRRLGRGGPRPATTRGGGASATPSCTTYRRTFREPRTFAPGLGQPVLQSSCGLALPRLGVRAIFPSRPLRRAHMDWGGARRERRRDPRRDDTTSVGHLPEGAHVVLLRGQS